MKKLIVLMILVLGGLYTHKSLAFSEGSMARWVLETNQQLMQGQCDLLADEFHLSLQTQANDLMEANKNQYCNILRASSAMTEIPGFSMSATIEDVNVKPAGFPWFSVEVSYKSKTTMRMPGMEPVFANSEDVMRVKRTFGGLKITELDSEGGLSLLNSR